MIKSKYIIDNEKCINKPKKKTKSLYRIISFKQVENQKHI